MRKIFSILVVLMMVAGTFVSCSMPTNDSAGAAANTSIENSNTVKWGSDHKLKFIAEDGKWYLCTKDFIGNPSSSNNYIACGGLKNYLPAYDDYLYVSDKEYNTNNINATFKDGILKITCSAMDKSEGTLKYDDKHKLQYKIN